MLLPAGSLSELVYNFTSSLLPVVVNGDTLDHGGFISFGSGGKKCNLTTCPEG